MEIYNRALALEMVGNEEELLQELEHSFVYDKVFSMAQLEELENKTLWMQRHTFIPLRVQQGRFVQNLQHLQARTLKTCCAEKNRAM